MAVVAVVFVLLAALIFGLIARFGDLPKLLGAWSRGRGMTTTGEALVRLLAAYGIKVVFGIPGVHTVGLYRGLPTSGLRHVTPRHEQGAGFMADGYARVTGRPAACFVVTGPGVTNILTAMGQAYGDSIPMLVISSVNRVAQLGMGSGVLHELRAQRSMAAGVCAFSHTLLSPTTSCPTCWRARSRCSVVGRPRPVHIEIPVDVIEQDAGHLDLNVRPSPQPPGPTPAAISRAGELLRLAERPLVVLGGGAVDAGEPALALVDLLRAPFINTVNAKGVMPKDHPLHMGENLGFAPLAGRAARCRRGPRGRHRVRRDRDVPGAPRAALRRPAHPDRHRPGSDRARPARRCADRSRCAVRFGRPALHDEGG